MPLTEIPTFPKFIERQLPTGIRRQVITVGREKMHIMLYGTGFPVLLLHGSPTWGFLWRKVIRTLDPKKFCAVMPDLIGLGFSSDPGRKAHSIETHAEWLGTAVDYLRLRELIFVGQDWGGPIGLRMLANRTKLARGLVILNTGIGVPPVPIKLSPYYQMSRRPIISNLIFDVLGFPMRTLHMVQGDRSSIRGDVAKAYRYAVRHRGHFGSPLSLARMVPDSAEHPSMESLRKCQAFITSFSGPVEIVWGTKDPILGRALKRIKSTLPSALVTETGAGHFLQEEVPLEISAAIERVYDRLSLP